jgi:nicotinamide mononucleotide (NMN) deamidase PncC
MIDLATLATQIGDLLKSRNMMLITAESCTGGEGRMLFVPARFV